jgi:cell wall-associated NlpC family hydrolase
MRHKFLFLSAFISMSALSAGWTAQCAASALEVESTALAPLAEATLTIGTRYRYGGKSPATGFDCSGLIAHIFESAWGLILPHNASAQSKVGTPVKRAALEPGDLLFYNTRNRPYSHVGIYLGEGRFIHAPRSGERVRVESIDSPYWRARFNGARRIEHPDA